MKHFIFLTLLFSQLTFGATLPNDTLVFDVYGRKISVKELQSGDEIKIIDENNKVQEAEIFNVSLDDTAVHFEVLDYENAEVFSQTSIKKSSHRRNTLINTRNFLIPITLLASSALPTVGAGPVTGLACAGMCPIVLTFGCGWFASASVTAAIGLAFPPLAPFAGVIVAGLCTNGAAAGAVACESACITVAATPFLP